MSGNKLQMMFLLNKNKPRPNIVVTTYTKPKDHTQY